MKSLIVPIAADYSGNENKFPYLFNLDDDGLMFCVKAICGLNLSFFDKIYFTILAKYDKRFYLSEMLNVQFKRIGIIDKSEIVVLDNPTKNQPDTVCQTIRAKNIQGFIMIKDADSSFTCDVRNENSVTIYALDSLPWVDTQHKSYVMIDDSYYVTNIIEKKILGRWFCSGGYLFEDSEDFLRYYDNLKKFDQLYISHIIYAMLLDGKMFRPIMVDFYKDWGMKENIKK